MGYDGFPVGMSPTLCTQFISTFLIKELTNKCNGLTLRKCNKKWALSVMQLDFYHFSITDTLQIINFGYFHSIMNNGIIFWANLHTKKSFSYKRKLRKLWQRLNPKFHVNLYQSIGNTDSTFWIHTIMNYFFGT